ncbi:hypothetical protein ACIRPQ_29415 [Streptomyces sp. NPDC101213]|uniref:hypothetical protein n=1 Tax=Streptomyces sp. NPDC101213 TaxID=3366130 RepID=UPI0037F90178
MDVRIDPGLEGRFTAKTSVFAQGDHAAFTEPVTLTGAQVLARLAAAPEGAVIHQDHLGTVRVTVEPESGQVLMWTFAVVAG